VFTFVEVRLKPDTTYRLFVEVRLKPDTTYRLRPPELATCVASGFSWTRIDERRLSNREPNMNTNEEPRT
jgi:hypothetical protein